MGVFTGFVIGGRGLKFRFSRLVCFEKGFGVLNLAVVVEEEGS